MRMRHVLQEDLEVRPPVRLLLCGRRRQKAAGVETGSLDPFQIETDRGPSGHLGRSIRAGKLGKLTDSPQHR